MLKDFLQGAEKVVICGIGNDVRGDDAFGVIVAEELKNRLKSDKIVILNCGGVPESYVGKIVNENPTHVIFIDAVDFGGKPGEIVIADPEGTLGESFSTHRLPLKLLVSYLKQNINAKFILIGCQPKQLGLFIEMSEEVKQSAEKLVEILVQELEF